MQTLAASDEWQQLSITYTGEELGSNFGLNFHIDPSDAASGGVVYVDDVSIEAID